MGLSPEERKLFEASKQWRGPIPCWGPGGSASESSSRASTTMQVQALMEAAFDRVAAGGTPVIEIMIPLTVTRRGARPGSQLGRGGRRGDLARRTPGQGAEQGACQDSGAAPDLEVLIGTMVETPRATLRADEIAEVADFFSFGTNDLTQMTFGFSRDDVEGRMMSAYLEEGLLPANPFERSTPTG